MGTRIELNDSAVDMVVKLSEGVPGAVVVLKQMLERGAEIDPDSFAGPFSGLLALDTLGIYGSQIWTLYKDVCGEDVVKTLATLRASQLSIVRASDILEAIAGGSLDADAILERVRYRLPRFGGARPAVTKWDFGDCNGPVPAHRHRNPDGSEGGWVADTATVEPTAYVGSNARVSGNAQVCGYARVRGYARVSGDAAVSDNASISGGAWISGKARVYGFAKVSENARVSGDARVHGHTEVCGNAVVVEAVRDERSPPGQNEEFALSEELLRGGVAMENRRRGDGSFIRYDALGKVHCDGAPAVRDKDGNEFWYEHGRRLDGPKEQPTAGPAV